eukprot:365477-Chlamydomonas_euryale.AAC.4
MPSDPVANTFAEQVRRHSTLNPGMPSGACATMACDCISRHTSLLNYSFHGILGKAAYALCESEGYAKIPIPPPPHTRRGGRLVPPQDTTRGPVVSPTGQVADTPRPPPPTRRDNQVCSDAGRLSFLLLERVLRLRRRGGAGGPHAM